MSAPGVTAPVFEHHHSGLGVGHAKPRISWRFTAFPSTPKSWVQTAYDVEVTSSPGKTETFHIESDRNVLVPWPAEALASRQSASVRIRVTGKSADASETQTSEWSSSSRVEAAFLSQGDFTASFIAADRAKQDGPLRPVRFRKTFSLPQNLATSSSVHARLYITALGVFNIWVNGKSASDEFLAPGWTSYRHRLVYRVLDISSLLNTGGINVISAEVGEGWYAGRLGFGGGERYRYGDELALAAQLEVHADASDTSDPWTLVTDNSWAAALSAIISSEIYDGETYDLNQEVDNWTLASTEWPNTQKTKIVSKPSAKLVAPDAPPVRVTETVACQKVFRSKSGKVILDFGQNLVGVLRVTCPKLADGQELTFRHAEVMESDELGVRPLRHSKATDIIIGSSGHSLNNWMPSFTFHGFRYVQVDGWPTDSGEPSRGDIDALVIHSDMRRRGFLETSNPHVNQLHSNVVWSMRGNFLSIPTDCPQRDERLGWTGDLQAFAPTATFLYDTVGMLGNWLEDVSAEQLEANGVVPLVVPEAMPSNWPSEANSQAVWGDVAVLAPNVLFQYSADTDLLERQFASMRAWLDLGVIRAPDGLWDPTVFQLADWLDPNAPPDDPAKATTDNTLVADAYLVHVTVTLAHLCAVIGHKQLASSYEVAGKDLKTKFQRRYITPDGNLVSLSQTGIALAIQFGLYDSLNQEASASKPVALVAATLEKLVRKAGFHISTGFAGTPLITHALTSIGKPQLAYRMLLEKGCPSWMYPVSMGATTIWERWDSMLPNGQINPGEMTSFNHYALGAVADWLHASVGGLSPHEPGWKVVRVRPVPGGNLTSAKVSFDGPYGQVALEWTTKALEGAVHFDMKLTVPPNSTAIVTLPSELKNEYGMEESTRTVGSGTHEFSCDCDSGLWPPQPIIHPFKGPSENTVMIE